MQFVPLPINIKDKSRPFSCPFCPYLYSDFRIDGALLNFDRPLRAPCRSANKNQMTRSISQLKRTDKRSTVLRISRNNVSYTVNWHGATFSSLRDKTGKTPSRAPISGFAPPAEFLSPRARQDVGSSVFIVVTARSPLRERRPSYGATFSHATLVNFLRLISRQPATTAAPHATPTSKSTRRCTCYNVTRSSCSLTTRYVARFARKHVPAFSPR